MRGRAVVSPQRDLPSCSGFWSGAFQGRKIKREKRNFPLAMLSALCLVGGAMKSVKITEEVHRLLKIAAARHGISIAAMLENVVKLGLGGMK